MPCSDDYVIGDDAIFPYGSTTLCYGDFREGDGTLAPLEVNPSILAQLGLNIDNTSYIAEGGRQSSVFVRLPPSAARWSFRIFVLPEKEPKFQKSFE